MYVNYVIMYLNYLSTILPLSKIILQFTNTYSHYYIIQIHSINLIAFKFQFYYINSLNSFFTLYIIQFLHFIFILYTTVCILFIPYLYYILYIWVLVNLLRACSMANHLWCHDWSGMGPMGINDAHRCSNPIDLDDIDEEVGEIEIQNFDVKWKWK